MDAKDLYGLDEELLNWCFILAFEYLDSAQPVLERQLVWNLLGAVTHAPTVYSQEALIEGYEFTPGETGGLESTAFIKARDNEKFVDEVGNDLSYSRYKNDSMTWWTLLNKHHFTARMTRAFF